MGFTVADMWRGAKAEWPKKRSRSPRGKYTANKKTFYVEAGGVKWGRSVILGREITRKSYHKIYTVPDSRYRLNYQSNRNFIADSRV